MIRWWRGARGRALLAWTARIAVLAALGGAAFYVGLHTGQPAPSPFPPRSLVVAVLPVGAGEASWIKTPDGRFVVIGAGPPEAGPALVASLRAAGARRINLLVLPYPYADALGGAVDLIQALPVQACLTSGWARVNRKQGEVEALLATRRIPMTVGRQGATQRIGDATLEVLAPGDPLVARSPAAGNNSLVVRLRWGKSSFLWCGGIEGPGEQALLERAGPRLPSDWLRVARLGNAGAASPELLRIVQPRYAVLSVGPNRDGLPDSGLVARLRATGAQVLRTDEQRRDLFFISDGERVVAVR